MGQSAIRCTDRRQDSPEARLHRLTMSMSVCRITDLASEGKASQPFALVTEKVRIMVAPEISKSVRTLLNASVFQFGEGVWDTDSDAVQPHAKARCQTIDYIYLQTTTARRSAFLWFHTRDN
jgi:hypothetical protein